MFEFEVFSGPHFLKFGLNTKIHRVNSRVHLRIESIPNTVRDGPKK